MFVGRKRELERLEMYYRSDAVSTCAIYGRRRVGKTRLIDEFCKGKPSIRFNLSVMDPDTVLEHMARDVAAFTGEDIYEARRRIRSFDDLTAFLATLDPEEHTVIVMDELPDAVAVLKDVPATLMRFIDGPLSSMNAFLIVCGSSISAMRRELNDGRGPLFGRFPVQMKVSPLTYAEARSFHPGASEEDMVRYYAVASGIPMYHRLMSMCGSPEAGIRELFLGDAGALYGETFSALSMEVSPMPVYNRVLSALANGPADARDLADRAGLSPTRCREVLDDLEGIDMVTHRIPYGSKGRAKRYSVADGSALFFYSVVKENEVLRGMDDAEIYDALRGRIDTFYGRRFEDICRAYILGTERCTWCGTWWGKVPVRDASGRMRRDDSGRVVTESVDVDIVARVDRGGASAVLMCECDFTSKRCGVPELEDLIDRSAHAMMGGESVEYVLFSRSGFTPELSDLAEARGDVRLVGLDGIARGRPGQA